MMLETRAGSIIESLNITTESPIRISACISLPRGPGILVRSFAPNAFLQNAIVAAASSWFIVGVTVPYCLGTGLIGFFAAFFFLLAMGLLRARCASGALVA